MDIKEKQLADVIIGKKCDMCNKLETSICKLARLNYTVGGWQGCMESYVYLDVCSGTCFVKACKKIKADWGVDIHISNISTYIIKELGELL